VSHWIVYAINNLVQIALIVFMGREAGRPRRSFIITYSVIAGIWAVLNTLVFAVFRLKNGDNIVNDTQTVIFFVILYLFTEGKVIQRLRAIAANCIAAILTELSIRLVIVSVYKIPLSELEYINTTRTVVSILALEIFYAWIMVILLLFRIRDEEFRRMRPICIINALLAVMFGAISVIYNTGGANKMNTQDIFVNQITHCLITILLMILYYAMKSSIEKVRSEEQLAGIESYMQHTRDFYDLAQQRYDDAAKIRHDIRNQVQTIEYLMSENDLDESKKSLEALRGKYSEMSPAVYSEVPAVNVIMALKMNECAGNGIRTDIVLRDCKSLPLDNYEICSLFSNILDNAIRSCKQAENGHIRIRSQVFGDNFILKAENSLPEVQASSSRSRRKGYGLEIIRSIIRKYDGTFSTESSEDNFTTLITIPVKCAE